MKINVIATGSAGNLYEILDSKGNSVLFETGIPFKEYLKFREGKSFPEFVAVTHEHGDHYKYFDEYCNAINNVFIHELKFETDNFKLHAIPVLHGECPCDAFILKSLVDNEVLFFATDFQYDEYDTIHEVIRMLKIERFLIECSYNDYLYHLANPEQRLGLDRHFSDNDLIRFIKKSGARLPKIITIHGSNRLSSDTYTKKYLKSKLPNAIIGVSVGATKESKNIFII